MPSIPTTVTSTPSGFQPAFTRVAQNTDFDCAFACIATIAGKTLTDVRQVAINQFKHPARGPYWITETLITGLLAHYGWVGTVYKEVAKVSDISDLAIVMVDYDPNNEIGRHVVFHRATASHAPKTNIAYAIDPAHWVEVSAQVRTDLNSLAPAWFIGVHPMASKAPTSK
ncbi:hypothetical protein [Bordetella sp. LUAb4]|uniref:hypothetical protein n=1 Tax=Bordetella sp. LUAb4 TaxID=2843195 RepID=UPI001E59B8DD|nr:hypothetical protein [Bordetella sp. LUAb4]